MSLRLGALLLATSLWMCGTEAQAAERQDAIEAFTRGDCDAALRGFKDIFEDQRTFSSGLDLAYHYRVCRQLPSAKEVLASMQEVWPERYELALERARVAEALGDRRSAIRILKSAPGDAARHPQVLEALAAVQLRAGDPSGTIGTLRGGSAVLLSSKALAYHSMMAAALTELGRHAEAVDHWREVSSAQPRDATAIRSLAKALGASGEADAAISVLSDALARLGDQGSLWLDLGFLYLEQGAMGDAVEAFDNAEVAFVAAGDEEGAQAVAESRVLSLRVIANEALAAGDIERAIRTLQGIADRDASVDLSLAYMHRLSGQFDRAGAILAGLQPTEDLAVPVAMERAALFSDQGEHAAAIAVLEPVVATLPADTPAAALALGSLYVRAQLGETLLGFVAGLEARGFDLQTPGFRALVAEGHTLLEQHAQAAEAWRSYVAMSPELLDGYLALSRSLLAADDTGEARATLELAAQRLAAEGRLSMARAGLALDVGDFTTAEGFYRSAKQQYVAEENSQAAELAQQQVALSISLRAEGLVTALNHEGAVEAYALAYLESPSGPAALRYAYALELVGRLGDAEEVYVEGLERFPTYLELALGFVDLLLLQQRQQEALGILERHSTETVSVSRRLAQVYLGLGRFEDAIRIAESTRSAVILSDLLAVEATAYLGLRERERVLEVWRRAIREIPDDLPLRLELVYALGRRQQYASAEEVLARAEADLPADGRTALARAWLWLSRGVPSRRRVWARVAARQLEASPPPAEIFAHYLTLARAYTYADEPVLALDAIERAATDPLARRRPLEQKGWLAVWEKDQWSAMETFEYLHALEPLNPTPLISMYQVAVSQHAHGLGVALEKRALESSGGRETAVSQLHDLGVRTYGYRPLPWLGVALDGSHGIGRASAIELRRATLLGSAFQAYQVRSSALDVRSAGYVQGLPAIELGYGLVSQRQDVESESHVVRLAINDGAPTSLGTILWGVDISAGVFDSRLAGASVQLLDSESVSLGLMPRHTAHTVTMRAMRGRQVGNAVLPDQRYWRAEVEDIVQLAHVRGAVRLRQSWVNLPDDMRVNSTSLDGSVVPAIMGIVMGGPVVGVERDVVDDSAALVTRLGGELTSGVRLRNVTPGLLVQHEAVVGSPQYSRLTLDAGLKVTLEAALRTHRAGRLHVAKSPLLFNLGARFVDYKDEALRDSVTLSLGLEL